MGTKHYFTQNIGVYNIVNEKIKKGKAFGEFQRYNFVEITPTYDDLDYNAIFCEGVFLQLMPLIFYLRKNSA